MRLHIWFLVILDLADISPAVAVPTCISIFPPRKYICFWFLEGVERNYTFAPCLPPLCSVPREYFNDVVFFEFQFIYAVMCAAACLPGIALYNFSLQNQHVAMAAVGHAAFWLI